MATTPTFDFSAKPWTTPAPPAGKGATGKKGDDGNTGTSSWDSGSTRYLCTLQPTDGKQGGAGVTPDPPPKANNGRPTGKVTQNLGVLKGDITIWYGAGDGQVGGQGGQGGDGGPGGAKGNNPNSACTAAKDGTQGPGGKGGNGGPGGDGGVTGLITIYYKDGGATFKITQVGCGAGNGGGAGLPGAGTGDLGGGLPGPGGTASTPPAINLNKQ